VLLERDGRSHVKPIADVCNLMAMKAVRTYRKSIRTIKWLDKIDIHEEFDAEEILVELEDIDLELPMNGFGLREWQKRVKLATGRQADDCQKRPLTNE
jgi:hypothetical protein